MTNEVLNDLRPEEQAEGLQPSDAFDLNSFFGDTGLEEPAETELLLTLHDDATESIATLTSKVNAETFAAGASLTSGVFSALGSIIGACGPLCFHGLSSLAQAGSSGLGASTGLGGSNMPGFSVDNKGNFNLGGDVNSLSRATGMSKHDLLSGKYSAEDILASLFNVFGEGMATIFGFGQIGSMIDTFFNNFGTTPAAEAI